ncbi:hypothetical protein [Moraxella nasicaprae]|uniref:Uncharacterized protein n=1 Tax=Moraxella nasicaprae TaxID=2904122 RepID=A0ABY6F411_9GAMM|nr:hypothetical protein [Moraxella nasicaprae]UXZ04774.1 hypothetical protein LU297_09465 [Moraxella nasicaprae]
MSKTAVVPTVFTAGLCLSSIVLSTAGYGFRLMLGESVSEVLRHAIMVVPVFVVGVPVLVWLVSIVLNKFAHTNIHPKNALTLGWLLSTVAILSIMGVYS